MSSSNVSLPAGQRNSKGNINPSEILQILSSKPHLSSQPTSQNNTFRQTLLNRTDIKFRISKPPTISQHGTLSDGMSANNSELSSPSKNSPHPLTLKLPPSMASQNPSFISKIDQNNEQIHKLMALNKTINPNAHSNTSTPVIATFPKVRQLQILSKESLPQSFFPSPLSEDSTNKPVIRKHVSGASSLSIQTQGISKRKRSNSKESPSTILVSPLRTPNLESQSQQQLLTHQSLQLPTSAMGSFTHKSYGAVTEGNEQSEGHGRQSVIPNYLSQIYHPHHGALFSQQQSAGKKVNQSTSESLTSRSDRKDMLKGGELNFGHPPKTAGVLTGPRNSAIIKPFTMNSQTLNSLPESMMSSSSDYQGQQSRLMMNYRIEGAKAKKSYCDLQDIVQVDKMRAVNSSHNTHRILDASSLKDIAKFGNTGSPLLQSVSITGLSTNNSSSCVESIKRMSNPFVCFGCEDIQEQLRKELSNYNTDVPSSRTEVITLQKWFDAGMQHCKGNISEYNSNNDEEILTFKYLNVCLSELLRQISLDCSERGALLKEVIMKLSEQSSKLVQKIRDDCLLEKSNLARETADMKQFFEKLYEKKDIEILQLNHLNEETNIKFSKENSIVDELYAKEKEMNLQINHLRQISTFLQTQLKASNKDNLKLRIKLKKKLDLEEKIIERIEGNVLDGEDDNRRSSGQSVGKEDAKGQQKQYLQPQYYLNQGKNDSKNQLQVPSFNNSLSESDINEDTDLINEKANFSLNSPYLRKYTGNNNPQLNIQNLTKVGQDQSQKSSRLPSRLPSAKSSTHSQVNKSDIQSPHASMTSSTSRRQSKLLQEKKLIKNIFDKYDNNYLQNDGNNSTGSSQNTKKQSQKQHHHISESTKKALELAIQEQQEESELSSVSSEDSKLIIDEAQNDMVNIESLNAVGFLDPDTAIRRECAETQVNDSLLAMTHTTVEIQTELNEIMDSKYDEFLMSNCELDYLIEFRINGLNNLILAYDSSSQIVTQKSIPSERIIKSRPSLMLGKQLNNPLEMYKGKFNRFEQMYEEGQEKIGELERKLSENIEKSTKREEELLQEIAEIKAQLKEEIEQEQRRIKELEEQERQRKIDEAEAEKQRKLELKKASEIPEKWRNYQSVNRKMGIELTKGSNAPKLGQIQAIDFEQKYQTDAGQQIVEKLTNKKYQKFKNFMPLSTLLKQINLIYQDRVKLVAENPRFREITCANFSYIFLTKLFGLKKIVDQKFIIFVLSLKKYTQIFRVNMFERFFNLIEQKGMNYTLDEFNKYIEALDFIQNQCQIGKDLEVSESETKYLVPYLKVASFVGNFADARMTSDETNEFKKEIDLLKESDPRYPNVPVMDLDVFVNKMLSKYKMLVNRAKTYVINAFDSSDLDGNGVCNLEEFLILNRNIEADNYNEEILTNIFNDNADVITDGEPTLTFDKFAAVCVDFNLFSEEAQDAFIGIRHKREIDMKFEELKQQWPVKQKEYETRVNGLQYSEHNVKEKWQEIIAVLNEKINSQEKQEVKPLLIAEKILDKELDFLEIFEQEGFEDEEALNQFIDQENIQNKVKNFNENMQNQVKEKMKQVLRKNISQGESPRDMPKNNVKIN